MMSRLPPPAAAPKAGGFSGFSMATKNKGPVPTASATTALANSGSRDEDENVDDEVGKTELVGELVEGKVDVATERPKIISAQVNTFHLGGAQHLRAKLDAPKTAEAAEAASDADQGTTAIDVIEQPAAAAETNSDVTAAQALLDEIRSGGAGSAAIFGSNSNDDERYRMDVATRAEEADTEAYASMPIEEFGKAYLRGYNWEEGQGLNGKGVAEPIEYVPRPQLLGLGAQSKAPDEGKKHKKFIKPGESREMAQRRAKQLQAIAKQTNDMIMQVLEDLGIEAQQGPDGRILLVSAFLLRPFRHRLARFLVCSFVVGGWMDGLAH